MPLVVAQVDGTSRFTHRKTYGGSNFALARSARSGPDVLRLDLRDRSLDRYRGSVGCLELAGTAQPHPIPQSKARSTTKLTGRQWGLVRWFGLLDGLAVKDRYLREACSDANDLTANQSEQQTP